ncbi:hypothetical protein AW27_026395 [Streptomyces sp. PCS3-D2]|uniref:hypothetical protein n=1 Tax=Streptomyces sp. PCS3-D2 TaxID=1460244 RepID=UPI0004533E90|nr:hypothetical protein [Streptomyces sp. PCS3-D2]WKV74738.1 hypothetical protein AW27_026395 [Streptomyces sp. PCS3-D2]
MRTHHTAAALIAATLLTLTGCAEADKDPASTSNEGKNQPTSAPAPSPSVDQDAARAAAGLPPEPDAATRKAYLDALNAIDPRIIKPGKDDQAVSRGINQCSSIKTTKDQAKLATLALGRFTVDTRLPEIATPANGQKINDVVHTHLCPTF